MDIKFIDVKENLFGHYRNEQSLANTSFHYHDGYELYYALDGERNYLTHNEIYSLENDCITLTRPYVIHGTSGKTYERLLLFFTDDFLSSYFQPPLIKIFHEVFSVDIIPSHIVREFPRIKELFQMVVSCYIKKDTNHAVVYLSELLLLLHDAIKLIPITQINTTIPTQMQDILTYISNNFASIKNIEQVANQFYFSKNHLFLMFKKTGFTFVEFLTKVKIAHALHLLKHTNNTITQISEECGFETPAYFCIVFKKKMKMTPQQYRAWIKMKNKPSDKSSEK